MLIITKSDALAYHSGRRPRKIEITPTKPCRTQRDLSMAYAPGVAQPCLSNGGQLQRTTQKSVSVDAIYPWGEIALQPGDRLLLYTDGVLEATNGAGQAFGEFRSQSVIESNSELSADRFSHLLLDEVRAWSDPNRQFTRSDDITFLVIDFR